MKMGTSGQVEKDSFFAVDLHFWNYSCSGCTEKLSASIVETAAVRKLTKQRRRADQISPYRHANVTSFISAVKIKH